MDMHVQSIPGGKVNIVGGHSCCVTKFKVDVYYCCPCVSMDTCLSLNCFNVSIATEGNCFVVYM
jgi:hypothetical protein